MLKRKSGKNFDLEITPFLELFDVKDYVKLMLNVKFDLSLIFFPPYAKHHVYRKLIDIFMHQSFIHHRTPAFV